MDKKVREELEQIKKYTLLSAKNYLSVDDLCAYAGISKAQVYRKIKERALPFSKPCVKLIYFLKADVDNWLGYNRVNSE